MHRRSSTPTKPPRSSPVRHPFVVPRSVSALPSRPSRPSSSPPCLLHSPPTIPRTSNSAHHHHDHGIVDFNAIQKIADGVERMVLSWRNETSGRAHMYAKAHDTLVASRSSWYTRNDQSTPPGRHTPAYSHGHESPAPQNLSREGGAATNLFAVRNLQSPAEPADMAVVDGSDAGGVQSEQARSSLGHGNQTTMQRPASATLPPSRLSNVSGLDGDHMDHHHDFPSAASTRDELYRDSQMTPCPLIEENRFDSYGGIETSNEHNNGLVAVQNPEFCRYESPPRIQRRNHHLDVHQAPILHNSHPNTLVVHEGSPVKLANLSAGCVTNRIASARAGTAREALSSKVQGGAKTERKRPDEQYDAKVQELEISLLECATEYEVQIVEMKMKMLQMKSEYRQKETVEGNGQQKSDSTSNMQDMSLSHCKNRQHISPDVNQNSSDGLKKRSNRSQNEKDSCPKLHKERHLELLRRSKDEAQNFVSCLQKQLSKKEQELAEFKLREKELTGQIQELRTMVQRGRTKQVEPKKLLSLLWALHDWLLSVKAGMGNDDPYAPRKSFQALPYTRMNLEDPHLGRLIQSPRIETIASIVNREIKTIQEILGKLTQRRLK